ncbi:MAG: hypothetical protein ACREUG_08360 [Steroidobacteraceae bacterium]
MTRVAVVSSYAFTGTSGTQISSLNGGADWADDNSLNGDLQCAGAGDFHCAYNAECGCSYKGAGAGSITTSQYAEVTLDGSYNGDGDRIGVCLLHNGGNNSTASKYDCYYYDGTSASSINIDRVIGGVRTNVLSAAASFPTKVPLAGL